VVADWFGGALTAGAVVSTTLTVKLAEAEWPAPSVAVHVTVVAPSANVEPDVGAHDGVEPPETASDAEAE